MLLYTVSKKPDSFEIDVYAKLINGSIAKKCVVQKKTFCSTNKQLLWQCDNYSQKGLLTVHQHCVVWIYLETWDMRLYLYSWMFILSAVKPFIAQCSKLGIAQCPVPDRVKPSFCNFLTSMHFSRTASADIGFQGAKLYLLWVCQT